jgi:antitoxin ParD1/3/4
MNNEVRMATTSLSLGPHWEKFVKREIASGRFASASEVVRAALRELEERGNRLKALQDHLGEGAQQARRREYVDFSTADVLKRAKQRAPKADKT